MTKKTNFLHFFSQTYICIVMPFFKIKKKINSLSGLWSLGKINNMHMTAINAVMSLYLNKHFINLVTCITGFSTDSLWKTTATHKQ